MTPVGLAWRSLSREPARAALGVLGVAAVGALLFDMLLLSNGLVTSFAQLLETVGFSVRVTATPAVPGTGPSIAEAEQAIAELSALEEIDTVVPFRFSRAQIGRVTDDPVDVDLLAVRPGGRPAWSILRGADLSPDAPVLINRELAEILGLGPGEDLELLTECGDRPVLLPRRALKVAGIVDLPFDASGQRTVVVELDAYRRVCAGELDTGVDILLVAEAPGVPASLLVAAIERRRPDLFAFTNDQLVNRFRFNDFSYFRQISFVLATVTLFFAFLLITSMLTVSVNQRFGEIAALRALGFTRGRVVADLLCESLLLVGAGGLLALPLGWFLALRLDSILKQMPGIPERLHFFVLEPQAVLVHLGLLGAAGLLASLYPIYLSARLPIAATLRRETVS
jgi:putative ABC transport system permease protein